MKNVKGWEVGTYFGIPVYKDVENPYPLIPWEEFYAHSRPYASQSEVEHRDWWVT